MWCNISSEAAGEIWNWSLVEGKGLGQLNFDSGQVYISETASPKLRGAMGSINQLGITVGILLAYCLGDAFSWRKSSLAGAAPAALLFVLMLFMPETARWLLSHQKETKARQNLQWLRGPRWDIDGEISEIQDSLGELWCQCLSL